jgi:hypothetical protein
MTATGRELSRLDDDFEEGEYDELGEGSPKADFAKGPASKPSDGQAAPANFAVNGTLPLNMIGSPTGPVPVTDPDLDTDDLYDPPSDGVSSLDDLTDEQISRLSSAELRAVAHDRGYDKVRPAGRAAVAQMFRKAKQADDAASRPQAATLEPNTAAGKPADQG